MVKKLKIVIILILCLVLLFLQNSVLAAEFVNKCTEDEADVIFSAMADKTDLKPGDTFTVTVSIDTNPENGLGLASADYRLVYDETQITMESLEDGPVATDKRWLMGGPADELVLANEFENARQIVWYGVNGGSDAFEVTGTILTATFRVNDDFEGDLTFYTHNNGCAAGGVEIDEDGYPVTDTAKVYLKSNFDELKVSGEDEYTLGDVNQDEKINIQDVRLALQSSLSKVQLSEEQKLAADVNKDGDINIRDVRLILQYSLNKITEF